MQGKTDTVEQQRDYVTELVLSQTSYDVFRILKDVTLDFDFRKFIIMHLPEEANAKIAQLAIITNWDAELISAYDTMGYISESPVIKTLKKSTLPLVWRVEPLNEQRTDGKARDYTDLFCGFGIRNGVYFHVSNTAGKKGALGFSGDRSDPCEAELMQMSYIAHHAYEVLTNINAMHSRVGDTLTERERECVYWTAAGKTSGDVAGILGISENTVNNYLSSSALKLDTVNKAHTVAKAIRCGLLDDF